MHAFNKMQMTKHNNKNINNDIINIQSNKLINNHSNIIKNEKCCLLLQLTDAKCKREVDFYFKVLKY